MKDQKKPQVPKFNVYWLYGAIIFALLSMSIFGGSDSWKTLNKTNISNFEKYLNISAGQNNPIAMKIIGVTFLKGSLYTQDYAQAKLWLRVQSKLGS